MESKKLTKKREIEIAKILKVIINQLKELKNEIELYFSTGGSMHKQLEEILDELNSFRDKFYRK